MKPFTMSGIKYRVLLLIVAALAIQPSGTVAQNGQFDVSGYFEALPVFMQTELPESSEKANYLEYRIQQRTSLDWHPTSNLSFSWQMRTRFFAGDLVTGIPGYAAAIDTDTGLIDLSWMIIDRNNWLLHYIPDRLYGEWANSKWSIRVGRQRVNWGVNMVTNPNDLFNIYSFYDFAYPERPGTDAIRIQRFLDFASSFELAISPGRDMDESVAAFLYSFNRSGYDVQLIGGYYRNMIVAGGGWAGSIRQTGFKGEVSWFVDLDDETDENRSNLVAAVSADYMFDNSIFLVVEALYNRRGGRDDFSLVGQPLSTDNPSFSRYQLTANASWPISILVNGSLAVIAYPDEKALFLSPQVTVSATNDIDIQVVSQFFTGSGNSSFAGGGVVLAGSVKWHF